jgi:GAF domain-containing protein
MTKPLDVERLRTTIRRELTRRRSDKRWERRAQRLRRLVRNIDQQRKTATETLETTCRDLTEAYHTLSGQMAFQRLILSYQNDLLLAKNDDDVFRTFFRIFVQRSGPLFGAALVCDANAELQVIGRFGVPQPDGLKFCKAISAPVIDSVLVNPQCIMFDATDEREQFDECIRKYLVGVNILAVPLIPTEGELIGLGVLYRKGEQPFDYADVALAETIAAPTAIAIQRNEFRGGGMYS